MSLRRDYVEADATATMSAPALSIQSAATFAPATRSDQPATISSSLGLAHRYQQCVRRLPLLDLSLQRGDFVRLHPSPEQAQSRTQGLAQTPAVACL